MKEEQRINNTTLKTIDGFELSIWQRDSTSPEVRIKNDRTAGRMTWLGFTSLFAWLGIGYLYLDERLDYY